MEHMPKSKMYVHADILHMQIKSTITPNNKSLQRVLIST